MSEILFKEKDPRFYVEMLFEFSPLFMKLVAEQVLDCSTRKMGEWLGLDTSLDARAMMDELKRRTLTAHKGDWQVPATHRKKISRIITM